MRRHRERPADDTVLMGEAARVLGIHRVTAYEQARDGVLPATWRGGRYEMTRDDLERERERRARAGANKAA